MLEFMGWINTYGAVNAAAALLSLFLLRENSKRSYVIPGTTFFYLVMALINIVALLVILAVKIAG